MKTDSDLYLPNWLPEMESTIREILGEGEVDSQDLAVLLCRKGSQELWSFGQHGQI
jgi:hypothetical protein